MKKKNKIKNRIEINVYLKITQPEPGAGAIHMTDISTFDTDDVCVIAFGHSSDSLTSESLYNYL